MNRYIYIILIIANIGFARAQYTAIPDSCFEYHLLDLGIDSEGTHDGQILTSDINSVVTLELLYTPCTINDLTGIEDFTSLEILHAEFHQLTDIDLSNNSELKGVWLNDNLLTTIDISNNLQLTELVCPLNQIDTFISGDNFDLGKIEISNNNLTELNVSDLSSLWYFGCGHNSITNLDLSQNINLELLGCGTNPFTFLDLRNGTNDLITYFSVTDAPDLTCIYVDDAEYSAENWENIDENSTFVETEAACIALASNEINTLSQIEIYPNPVTDMLFIENSDRNSIKIYNLLGELIMSKEIINNMIDISDLSNGTYIIQLDKNDRVITKKIMKI